MLAPQLPSIIASRYVPVRLIAQGGMGAVYEVEHARTGQHLALKVLLLGVGSSAEAIERFKREARASARIKSEHVVRVIDADVAPELEGAPFLVMELLEGMDLERAASASPPSQELVVEWLRQVARAIDKAHHLGIVHRDLKPENLFLTTVEDRPPIVKVLDFGIVKMIEDGTGATGSGAILGTPKYMAPEQATSDGRVTPATDRYALGLVAYRLLTGTSYYHGDVMSILGELLYGSLEPPSKRHPGLGGAFDAWFLRACHRSPAERFTSAAEQIESLSAALGMPKLATEPAREPIAEGGRHRPRVVALMAAASLVVAAVVIAAFLSWRSGTRGPTTVGASVTSPPSSIPTVTPTKRDMPRMPTTSAATVPTATSPAASPPPSGVSPAQAPQVPAARSSRAASKRVSGKSDVARGGPPSGEAAPKTESSPTVDPFADQK